MGYANRPRKHNALGVDAQPWRICLPTRRGGYSDSNTDCESFGYGNTDSNGDGHSHSNRNTNTASDAYTENTANTQTSSNASTSRVVMGDQWSFPAS
jgi:hypothetical protein